VDSLRFPVRVGSCDWAGTSPQRTGFSRRQQPPLEPARLLARPPRAVRSDCQQPWRVAVTGSTAEVALAAAPSGLVDDEPALRCSASARQLHCDSLSATAQWQLSGVTPQSASKFAARLAQGRLIFQVGCSNSILWVAGRQTVPRQGCPRCQLQRVPWHCMARHAHAGNRPLVDRPLFAGSCGVRGRLLSSLTNRPLSSPHRLTCRFV